MNEPVGLKKIVVTGQRRGPHLLVTGGVHGDELEPVAAVRWLVAQVERAQLTGTLTLVPVVNEAAWQRRQRTADDQLDLARTCPGRPDGSVTERTAHLLSLAIRRADYYIDLHSGGDQLQVYPLVGYMLHADREVLQSQRGMARAFNLPVVWGTDAQLPGRSLSVARDARIPAIYAEYGGGGSCDLRGVAQLANGCLHVMAHLDMLRHGQPGSAVRWVVEDARAGSGHMQSGHPAPCAGFFRPAVPLGSRVATGQRLGTIADQGGHRRTPVPAAGAGLVLVLRRASAVQAGDALATLLPG